jgi:hypothetical protein
VQKVHTNIYDVRDRKRALVECRPAPNVRKFKSVLELAQYSVANKKIFPREMATGTLAFMLRHLFQPGLDDERRSRRGRKAVGRKGDQGKKEAKEISGKHGSEAPSVIYL